MRNSYPKESKMIRRRAVLGLSLLSALVFCAFFAQSAAAVSAKNTTAYTCVENGVIKEFEDAHCDNRVGAELGKFGHLPIPIGQTTSITVTNAKTKAATFESTPTVFKFMIGGKPVEVSCTLVHGIGNMHNMEPQPGEHKVTGTLSITVTGCKVKPMKCFVKEPIEFKVEFEGVEGLGPEENTHGIEIKPHVEGGGPLLTITLEGPECPVKGVVPIEGTMIATGGPNPKERHSGATTVFTNEMTKETLKVEKLPAEHSGALTLKMSPIEGVEQNPIAFTTTT
jgi:hypothetical protein